MIRSALIPQGTLVLPESNDFLMFWLTSHRRPKTPDVVRPIWAAQFGHRRGGGFFWPRCCMAEDLCFYGSVILACVKSDLSMISVL